VTSSTPARRRATRALLALLITLCAAGLAVGTAPVASAASPTPVPCASHGHKKNGHAEYDCSFYKVTAVYSGVHTGQRKVGTLHGGRNWVLCQAVGKSVTYGKNVNHWWAYTLSDQGTWGWVNAVNARGGSNNGKWKNVPACSMTTRYDGEFYPDYPPQTYAAYGAKLACEVYDDPFAEVYAATCQRYHLSNGYGATKATASGRSTTVCDLRAKTYHGRRICEITGTY
jgi:hypothetical protein